LEPPSWATGATIPFISLCGALVRACRLTGGPYSEEYCPGFAERAAFGLNRNPDAQSAA